MARNRRSTPTSVGLTTALVMSLSELFMGQALARSAATWAPAQPVSDSPGDVD
jgi:hypothetical protein